MISITRRSFAAGSLAAGAALMAMPAVLRAQAKPKLVVIGGGPAGATVAKYVARDSQGAIDVTLVEPLDKFVTCFHSNLFLGGYRSYDSLIQPYKLANYGVKHVRQMASAIDRDKKQVRLADGSTLSYDRLVVAPGIDLKFELGARLFGSRKRGHAACLEARPADSAPEKTDRCASGWGDHRDDRAAKSVSLPARPL